MPGLEAKLLEEQAVDTPGTPAGSLPGEHPDVAGQHTAEPAGADQPPAGPRTADEAEGPQPSPEPGKPRRLLYVTLPGCWGALIVACLSFTPSLLPRSGTVQGVVWGIATAIGSGLGVLFACIWRAFRTVPSGISRNRDYHELSVLVTSRWYPVPR
jgi:uncharacterized membrane protein